MPRKGKSASAAVYGDRKRREDSMDAVPSVPDTPSAAPSGAPPTQAPQSMPPAMLPGMVTPLNAPTMRPDEPVLAGVNVGEGPGPQITATPQMDDSMLAIRKIYAITGIEEFLDLIERNGQ